jgi:hypothetical protein
VSFYDVLVMVSLILWVLIGVGVIVSVPLLLPRLLGAMRQLEQLERTMVEQATPLLEQSQHVLDQVSKITTSMADDVDRVDRTVIRTTESLERMIELAEDRVSDINALLEVAVEEAEETFFSTAALMRVLRPGSRSRRRRRRGHSISERRRLG